MSMKKTMRVQIASEIIAQLKREMKQPQWAKSARNRVCPQIERGAKEPENRFEIV